MHGLHATMNEYKKIDFFWWMEKKAMRKGVTEAEARQRHALQKLDGMVVFTLFSVEGNDNMKYNIS